MFHDRRMIELDPARVKIWPFLIGLAGLDDVGASRSKPIAPANIFNDLLELLMPQRLRNILQQVGVQITA